MRLNISKQADNMSKSDWRPFIKMIGFWLLLNLLLFISGYLLQGSPRHLLPYWGTGETYGWKVILFFNDAHHPFLLSGDWVVLSCIAPLLIGQIPRNWLQWGLSTIYFFLFAYSVYYAIYGFIYGTHPYFLSNVLLISNVFPIFLGTLGISQWPFIICSIIIISFVFYGIWFLQGRFLMHLERSRSHFLIMPLISACVLYMVIGHLVYMTDNLPKDEQNIRWWCTYILKSTDSLPVQDWRSNTKEFQKLDRLCRSIRNDTTDIYLFVIESYGAVATEVPKVAGRFRPFLDSVGTTLGKDGWNIASSYSISPIKGGRSWLSFTTIMTGKKIDNQYAYENFLANGKEYPHLFNCLRENGFHTTWMNTMKPPKEASLGVQDSLIRNVWGFDEWIRFQDIDYNGRRFDPYGGIPDQYALNTFRERRESENDQPDFLFFINTGSHSPWFAPPPIVVNHRTLNQTEGWHKSGFELSSFENYEESMRYQIEYISQFIRRWGDANDLFLLIGDHQPPAMEYKLEDIIHLAAVPYHAISKNPKLLNSFFERGATNGMIPVKRDSISVRHQDIYEIILESLQ